jgi:predicted nucleotidyltransferase
MKIESVIDPGIFSDVQNHFTEIEKKHNVVILQAIESGSRAWGFPSPDSDYDVRFIYAHPSDWYLQLTEERDVIELPINDELDIAGWDLRKAFNLANKGNAVIQEWMISPIVYKQSDDYSHLFELISKAFNPISAYHHYRSMAKKAYLDIEQSEKKKLKRFFYFARATLSAKWILETQTMPRIVFADLVNELVSEKAMINEIESLVIQKAKESEQSLLEVPPAVYLIFTDMFKVLDEGVSLNSEASDLISNDDFRGFLNSRLS